MLASLFDSAIVVLFTLDPRPLSFLIASYGPGYSLPVPVYLARSNELYNDCT